MKYKITFSLVLIFLFLNELHAETKPFWVFFKDRGTIDIERVIAAKRASPFEPKNLGRRAKILGREQLFDEFDVPVNPEYIAAVADYAVRLRIVSRYFNAVTVDLDDGVVDVVERLPFVRGVEPVKGFRKPFEPSVEFPVLREKPLALDYGNSFEQLRMVGVTPFHGLGYMGDGILIAVLDSGFDNLEHAAFDSLTVSHRWDFIGGDDDVGGDDHGTRVLSIMAALDHGSMIGSAPYATYILARTEDINKELRIEEDYWIAAIEWADSLGVDVVHSSLGYSEFADFSYTYDDMDGETARTTIAANWAVERGIVVVTSVGNQGNETWYYISSPADGFNVIAVGSVDKDGMVSSFSSRGPAADGRVKPDFVALGEQVWMAESSTSNDYHYSSGTSFAAPLVSGAVALILEANPVWTPEMVNKSLKETAKEAGPDTLYGYGFIDAYTASGLKDHYLRLLTPNGGEEWNPGQTYTIAWETRNVETVKISYSADNGMNWNTIAFNVEAVSGSYDWTVPNDPSSDCRILIEDEYETGTISMSNALFTIRSVVSSFKIYDPYPQPFILNDADMQIFFPMDVPENGSTVFIRIYNFTGENIKTIEWLIEKAGSFRDRTEAPLWDVTNYTGDEIASGVYYYTIQLDGYGGHKGKIAVIK